MLYTYDRKQASCISIGKVSYPFLSFNQHLKINLFCFQGHKIYPSVLYVFLFLSLYNFPWDIFLSVTITFLAYTDTLICTQSLQLGVQSPWNVSTSNILQSAIYSLHSMQVQFTITCITIAFHFLAKLSFVFTKFLFVLCKMSYGLMPRKQGGNTTIHFAVCV